MMRITLLFFCFNAVSLSGAIYKGQRAYSKVCITCHTSGIDFIKSKTIKEWELLLDKNGEVLSSVHLKNSKAQDSWSYFQNKKFKKDSRNLKQFLMEYAKDSNKVPVLN